MKRLFIGLILLTLLALPTQHTTVNAAREGDTSRARFSAQGDGTTIYLPLISNEVAASQNTSGYRQNALFLPYGDQNWLLESSVFWFGKVTPSENYVDVRTGYTDTHVFLQFEVFDRMLWYDTTPTPPELTQYDAISLYLRPAGVSGNAPDAGTYRFVAQNHLDYLDKTLYHAEYRGDGSRWVSASVPYELKVSYQGEGGFNQTSRENRGWLMTFKIPFSSLGLSGKPAAGSAWGMAVTLHDRDDSSGPLPVKNWPPAMADSQPLTWAELGFDFPTYTPPKSTNPRTITIRQGLNASNVPDAGVGGSTICGDIIKPEYFLKWGDLPESAYTNYTVENTQVNIQNQVNLGDWPCFAKYYITFPLDAVPDGKVILSAKLYMHHFGNSAPSLAEVSWIHVMTANSDWNENTLTWNNAPMAAENFAARYVNPLESYPGDLGVTQEWTISPAAERAYRAGEPLRLILYSSDLSMHSGKYFFSSEYSIADARPTLVITYGDPAP